MNVIFEIVAKSDEFSEEIPTYGKEWIFLKDEVPAKISKEIIDFQKISVYVFNFIEIKKKLKKIASKEKCGVPLKKAINNPNEVMKMLDLYYAKKRKIIPKTQRAEAVPFEKIILDYTYSTQYLKTRIEEFLNEFKRNEYIKLKTVEHYLKDIKMKVNRIEDNVIKFCTNFTETIRTLEKIIFSEEDEFYIPLNTPFLYKYLSDLKELRNLERKNYFKKILSGSLDDVKAFHSLIYSRKKKLIFQSEIFYEEWKEYRETVFLKAKKNFF